LAVFLILSYSRLIDVLPLRALPVLGAILIVYGLLTSHWADWLITPPTLLLLLMTAWMLVSALVGDWPGGSAMLIAKVWSRAVLFYLIIVCVGRGLTGVKWIMSSIAWATGVIVLMGLLQSGKTAARFAIGDVSLSNPNDLAFVLLLGVPFCAWYVLSSGRPRPLRLAMAAIAVSAILMVLRTGSRMGLVALACIVIVLAVTVRRVRLLLPTAALLFGLAGILLLPKEIKQRYETIVSNEVGGAAGRETEGNGLEVERAVGSTASRWGLFVASLQVTLQHPVFGVGPGNFSVAEADMATHAARRALWQETHNAYTQMSSECGIPGAILFLSLIIYCLRCTNRLRKALAKDLQPQATMALWLLIAAVILTVSDLFMPSAYDLHLPLLAGIVASLKRSTSDYPSRLCERPASSDEADRAKTKAQQLRSRTLA
jgi:O-antigen ligase